MHTFFIVLGWVGGLAVLVLGVLLLSLMVIAGRCARQEEAAPFMPMGAARGVRSGNLGGNAHQRRIARRIAQRADKLTAA